MLRYITGFIQGQPLHNPEEGRMQTLWNLIVKYHTFNFDNENTFSEHCHSIIILFFDLKQTGHLECVERVS